MTAPFAIEPVARVSLVDSVARSIRDLIERERLATGHRLPGELEWAERLGVSRPVVREAVGRLQSLGLVTVSRGRGRGLAVGGSGDVVRGANSLRAALAVSPKDDDQLQEFRTAVEVHAARLAASCITDDELADLARLADEIDRAGRTREERIQADFAFHRRIVEISKNTLMLNILIVAQTLIEDGIRDNWHRHRSTAVDSRKAHERIIAALRRRDGEAAQQAMLDHIRPTPAPRSSSDAHRKSKRAAPGRPARRPAAEPSAPRAKRPAAGGK
jgi:GntR family transcriptional repressor for pyruvate dehydrogenase complex